MKNFIAGAKEFFREMAEEIQGNWTSVMFPTLIILAVISFIIAVLINVSFAWFLVKSVFWICILVVFIIIIFVIYHTMIGAGQDFVKYKERQEINA